MSCPRTLVGTVLASWNVHGWVGEDRIRNPDRTFESIRRLDADVVALQEVEGTDWETHGDSAGYTTISGPTAHRSFGNALLVRAPLVSLRRLDLSVPGREPRGALDAVVELGGDPLRVVATHLGLRASERRLQAARLAQHLQAHDAGIPTALLGDLNDWTWRGRQLAQLARVVGPFSRVPTFPSRRPILPLDRAACRTPGLAPAVHAVRCPSVRRASDHLPLRIRLDPCEHPMSGDGSVPRNAVS